MRQNLAALSRVASRRIASYDRARRGTGPCQEGRIIARNKVSGSSRHDLPGVSGTGPRLYEQAHAIIAAQIHDGTFGPGDRLSETQIADRFGISRAPARQALARLVEDGLIAKADGRGYVVADIQRKTPPSPAAQSPAPQRLRTLPGWQRIYQEVESEIVQRAMVSDLRVIEAELARYFNVSRTIARDVLGRLQQAGLITKDNRSRWHVPALTPDYVAELYELRAILEPEALGKAAGRVPEDFLAHMAENLRQALASPEQNSWDRLDQLEDEMHSQLLGYCDSRAMLQAIRLHHALLIAHRFLYRNTAKMFEIEPFLAEHLAVVEALQSGDIETAKDRLRRHLMGSGARAMDRIAHILKTYDPVDLPYLEFVCAQGEPG